MLLAEDNPLLLIGMPLVAVLEPGTLLVVELEVALITKLEAVPAETLEELLVMVVEALD